MPRVGVALLLLAAGAFGVAGVPATSRGPERAAAAAASLSVDDCTEVKSGDIFDLDVRVQGVSDLLAWEVYFAYDRSILEVVGRDVRVLLDRERGSNVFDFSDPVPNSAGLYRLAAADLSMEGSAESGSGVLGRITLRARSKGISYADVLRDDLNGDTIIDIGPTLTGTGGAHLDDINGDGIFDGAITSGQIAVDRSCQEPPPTPKPGDIAATPHATAPQGGATASPAPGPTGNPGPTPTETMPATTAPSPDPTASRTPAASTRSPVQGTVNGGNQISDEGGSSTGLLAGILAIAAVAFLAVALFVIRSSRRRS